MAPETNTKPAEPTPQPVKTAGYDLDNLFNYHAPKEGQPERYANNREAVKTCAQHIIANANGHSRELSLAMTHLEQALSFANAAIARNG